MLMQFLQMDGVVVVNIKPFRLTKSQVVFAISWWATIMVTSWKLNTGWNKVRTVCSEAGCLLTLEKLTKTGSEGRELVPLH